MNIQQLKYVVEVEKEKTIRGASKKLFIAQSSLSTAIKDLEEEIGISIFIRSKKGVTVTKEGAEFIEYAKQVLAQLNVIEETYIKKTLSEKRFSVSSQHYDFASEAFSRLINEIEEQNHEAKFTFRLLETDTKKVLRDVYTNISEIGLIYISEFNEKVLYRLIESYGLKFEALFEFQPKVFLGRNHPLADKDIITYQDLAEYPALTFEQSEDNSYQFSEEPLEIQNHNKKVLVSDRTTAINLLVGSNCYLTGSGIMRSELTRNMLVSIPLNSQTNHVIGLISTNKKEISTLAKHYIEIIQSVIKERSDI